jgi:RNA-directed DNA polymerase
MQLQIRMRQNRMKIQNEMVTLEDIMEGRNVLIACQKVMSNGGASGIDGMPTTELKTYLMDNWRTLQKEVLEERYRPEAIRRVEIPKPQGGIRQLGIPTVMDRMLQQVIHQELDKEYDATFSESSYGFRQGRSAHQALDAAQTYLNSGLTYVVEIDLEKFFDRVNHDKLMNLLSKRISDKRVLKLIRRYLESGVLSNGVVTKTEEGTPQGGPLSPILSNILLDELDKELERRGHRFVRYADDISIFASSQRGAERILSSITQWLETKLKLKVNQEKSGIRRPNKGNLLGFGFWHSQGGEILPRVSEKSYTKLKEKIRKITSRSWSVSMTERLVKLTQVTRGWINYFSKANAKKRLTRIDEWTRMRLRMCIWKQWKRTSARMKNLQKLGATKQQAYEWSNTRKGYCRIAHSPILHRTITNERLKQRGYISLEEMYNHRRSKTQ